MKFGLSSETPYTERCGWCKDGKSVNDAGTCVDAPTDDCFKIGSSGLCEICEPGYFMAAESKCEDAGDTYEYELGVKIVLGALLLFLNF